MRIIKWIDDCIDGNEKEMEISLRYVLKEFKKGNPERPSVSDHLSNIRKSENEIALLSLIKQMILEELKEK